MKNRALYDKRMKLGTLILGTIWVILKNRGILDSYRGSRGSHFSRWPPVSKIGQYVNDRSHIKPLIVGIAVENNTCYL